MGWRLPPLYGVEELGDIIDKISKIDESINNLAIEREMYVKTFKEKIEEIASAENQD